MPIPIKEDDLTRVKLEVGKVVRLKDIFFDSDKADLLPRSYVELDKLVIILKENPKLEIEIIGHTDNVGDSNYNLTLSRRRAAMVMDYLTRNGIVNSRLRANGFGDAEILRPARTRRQHQQVVGLLLQHVQRMNVPDNGNAGPDLAKIIREHVYETVVMIDQQHPLARTRCIRCKRR